MTQLLFDRPGDISAVPDDSKNILFEKNHGEHSSPDKRFRKVFFNILEVN